MAVSANPIPVYAGNHIGMPLLPKFEGGDATVPNKASVTATCSIQVSAEEATLISEMKDLADTIDNFFEEGLHLKAARLATQKIYKASEAEKFRLAALNEFRRSGKDDFTAFYVATEEEKLIDADLNILIGLLEKSLHNMVEAKEKYLRPIEMSLFKKIDAESKKSFTKVDHDSIKKLAIEGIYVKRLGDKFWDLERPLGKIIQGMRSNFSALGDEKNSNDETNQLIKAHDQLKNLANDLRKQSQTLSLAACMKETEVAKLESKYKEAIERDIKHYTPTALKSAGNATHKTLRWIFKKLGLTWSIGSV